MTDLEAVAGRPVPRETLERLQHFRELLTDENQRQNLISRTTVGDLWNRHILDSAQLVRFEPHPGASWVDIGSGAGLPGLVISALVEGMVLLVEPRKLRADFLQRTAEAMGLANRVTVAACKAERASGAHDVITARAVAAVDKLLDMSTHLSTGNSIWVLPKGRSARSELDEARRSWQCEATSVPSRTDPESEILLLRHVRPRGKR